MGTPGCQPPWGPTVGRPLTLLFPFPVPPPASSPTSSAQNNVAAGLRNNSLTNQDVSFDPCGDTRLRNSCMSLDEKTRTMSRSGSFRDGFEEGKRTRPGRVEG